MFVKKSTHHEVVMLMSWLQKHLAEERAEVKRLTNVIINMRRDEGYTLEPQHMDERWDGGKYVMEEEMDKVGQPTTSDTTVLDEEPDEGWQRSLEQSIDASIEADLRRVFKD
jgi:hypothetical protein